MLLGNVSLSSQDPFNSVNLKRRAQNTLGLVRTAVRSGKIALPDKVRANLEWEMMDIQKGLDVQVVGAPFECKSLLPAAWLQARWEAVFPPQDGMWYPYFRFVGGKDASVRYAHSEQIKSMRAIANEAGVVASLSDAIDLNTKELVLSFEGRRDSTYKLSPKVEQFLATYRPQRDPLTSLEFVQVARATVHNRRFEFQIFQMRPMPGPSFSQVDVLEREKNAPLLLEEEEKLKFRVKVTFEQTPQGTAIALSNVFGVEMASIVALVQIQRLCVILLWLTYGNEMAALDQTMVSYVEADERMKTRGLSDLDSDDATKGEENWETLDEAIEKEMVRRKATPITGIEAGDFKAWADQKRFFGRVMSEYIIVSAKRVSAIEIKDFELCLRQKAQRVSGAVLLIAREVDGTAVRHLSELLRSEPRILSYAALETGLLAASQWVTERCNENLDVLVDPIRQLETFFKAIRQPSPQIKSGDLLLDLAQRMSLVDPVLSSCWLALRHCQWLKQTN